jgi:3-hydroxyisobutyrate dehydrogenase-like beta-hydroxyacid dehydrogenase
MVRIAVLGVGRMGAPIARRLAASAEVVAFDPDARRLAELGDEVETAPSQDAAVVRADIVVAVLPGAREQPTVLRRALATGSLDGEPGMLLVDLTSGHPGTARELQAAARRDGAGYVAAPMSGDPAAAAEGALQLLVGGTAVDVEKADAVIAPLVCNGGRARHISEDAGAAPLAKLLVNGLWFAQAIAMAEAVRTGERAGLPASVLRDVLRGSAADSAYVDRYLDRFLAGDEMTEFALHRVVEELDILGSLQDVGGFADGVLAASHAIHARALAEFGEGHGELTAAQWVRGRHAGASSSPPSETSSGPTASSTA